MRNLPFVCEQKTVVISYDEIANHKKAAQIPQADRQSVANPLNMYGIALKNNEVEASCKYTVLLGHSLSFFCLSKAWKML